jgi:hypothetical protein
LRCENEFDYSLEEGGNVFVINKVKLRRVEEQRMSGSIRSVRLITQ